MKKSLFIAAFAFVGALVANSANAQTTIDFDPATGSGFVGKGAVQTAFGWNNKQLQSNASGVTFTYATEETYSYVCTFTVFVGKDKVPTPQTTTRGKEASVNASIAFDPRVKNQITGFTLSGFGSITITGEVPVEGSSCPGGPLNDGIISNVQMTGSTGGLYVNHNGTIILL